MGLPNSPRNSMEEYVEQLRLQQERWEQRHRETRREWRESVLTAAAVLAALFAAWQGYEAHSARVDADRAALEARQDAKDASEKARRDAQAVMQLQLDAARASQAQAERSAKAAEESASIAILSLHVSERAYVDVDAGLTSTPKAGEKLSFRVLFANSGRTPALEVVTNARSGFTAASATPDQAHSVAFGPTAQVPSYSSKSVLAPGAKVQTNWQTVAPLTQTEVDALKNHLMLIYVFARATYKDEFRRSHETNFCGYFDPTAQGGVLLQCSSFNTAN